MSDQRSSITPLAPHSGPKPGTKAALERELTTLKARMALAEQTRAARVTHTLRTLAGGVRLDQPTLARAVALVGAALLLLSVIHVTEGIGLITGGHVHWAMAALMAIGIDAGMAGCEVAAVVYRGRKQTQLAWAAHSVVIIGAVTSALINGYAFSAHHSTGPAWAPWALGALIPVLVLLLWRVAGILAEE